MSKNKTNVTKEAFKQLFKKGDIILLVVVLVLVALTIYFALTQAKRTFTSTEISCTNLT
jgi:hypothetical protein